MKPKKLTKEQLKMTPSERRIDEMKRIMLHLLDRNVIMWNLVQEVGVKKRVAYYNMIGRATGNVIDAWVEEKQYTDYGLVFNDGTEINGVDVRHFNFFKDAEREERRKRKSSYVPDFTEI